MKEPKITLGSFGTYVDRQTPMHHPTLEKILDDLNFLISLELENLAFTDDPEKKVLVRQRLAWVENARDFVNQADEL